jgi:signal transduction histidine kinase
MSVLNTIKNLELKHKKIREEIYKKNVELLEQRRRTEQLLYGVSEAIFAVNPNYQITLFNHTAENFTGKSAGNVTGKKVDDIIKLEYEGGIPIHAKDYCFQGNPEKGNLEGVVLKTPYKDFYVNVKTNTIALSDGVKECLVTVIDLTKERALEKTKDEFISITSHELRTPITIIKSYLWMLDQGKAGKLAEKQKYYLSKAISGTERMLNLINDTLNISRIEQGKIIIKVEEIDLKEFTEEMFDEFKIKTDESKLWLKFEPAEDLYNIYADKAKLREIFTNFIGNSIKFTHKGGITIKIRNLNDDFVKVSIVDTGRGFSKEDSLKLFKKFGRLDNSYSTIAEAGGTGLGLYIAKSLTEKMGGMVGAESEGPDKGSTFWFTLPSANPNAKICSLVH